MVFDVASTSIKVCPRNGIMDLPSRVSSTERDNVNGLSPRDLSAIVPTLRDAALQIGCRCLVFANLRSVDASCESFLNRRWRY